MLNRLLKFLNPDHGLKIYKPGADKIISLPCGNKVKASGSNDPLGLGLDQIVEKDQKYYGRRKINGKWIVDGIPIEFNTQSDEKQEWEYWSAPQKIQKTEPFKSRWKNPGDEDELN